MKIAESYDCYHEQYHRHLDEYMSFMTPVQWDMDRIAVTVKGNTLVLTRPDKKRLKLNVLQVIGLLRYAGKRLQEIEVMEGDTNEERQTT